MPATLTSLIASCRTLAGDGTMNNMMRAENCNSVELGNIINAENTIFYVKNIPVVTGGFQVVRVDNTILDPSKYTVNEPIGQIILQVAPINSVFATYYYYLFPDTDWTEFVTSALEAANVSSGDATDDVPLIPDGMLASIKIFAQAFFCVRISAQTGLWFNQRLQERVDDRDTISSKYAKRADAYFKLAQDRLVAFYQDRMTVPGFGIVEHQPRPWTPVR